MADDVISDVLLLAGRFQVRGSCAYTLRLLQRLPELGWPVRVVCPNASVVESSRRSKLPLDEYPYLDSWLWGRIVRYLMLRDQRLAQPRLLHIQSRRALATGTWLARRLGCPYVLTVHDHLRPKERLHIDPKLCQRIIAVSQSVKTNLVTSAKLPESLIAVIASGVEVAPLDEALPPLDPGHTPVVGTAGPLEALKGLPFFLNAARQVLSTGRQVEFLVAGAGPEEANLRRLARELGIASQVTFVPNLCDFEDPLRAMDVYCLPSLQQGLGTVMLEAMALGRPVIATGVGGVYDVVRDGETGLIVPPSDSSELARRITELLDDPLRARSLGAAARKLVERDFRVDRMVRQTAELYREVIEGEAGPRTIPLSGTRSRPNDEFRSSNDERMTKSE
jgi:glycosyltransferase involved in cell wall biosynthesis